jgi:hypothetical protein
LELPTFRPIVARAGREGLRVEAGQGIGSGVEGQIMQCGCREPSLNEMMQDPIIKAVMQRDAVQEAELRRLMDRMRATYHGGADRGGLNRLRKCG